MNYKKKVAKLNLILIFIKRYSKKVNKQVMKQAKIFSLHIFNKRLLPKYIYIYIYIKYITSQPPGKP